MTIGMKNIIYVEPLTYFLISTLARILELSDAKSFTWSEGEVYEEMYEEVYKNVLKKDGFLFSFKEKDTPKRIRKFSAIFF